MSYFKHKMVYSPADLQQNKIFSKFRSVVIPLFFNGQAPYQWYEKLDCLR
ncbi:MAG: hypothetical protein ACI83I_002118 [Bacteroidia bacterium]|jgi:hypothetical protein